VKIEQFLYEILYSENFVTSHLFFLVTLHFD